MKLKILFIMVVLCLATSFPGFMLDTVEFTKEAEALKTLGLFNGTNNGFELDRAPTRVEAAAMLVKLLGAENEAKSKHYKHPFTDVPSWATDFVGYLYEYNMTTGIGNNQFGSANLMSAKDFTVFVLKSLGYASDFSYADTMNFAVSKKLITAGEMDQLTRYSFKRDEMVLLAFNALKTNVKGETFTLGDKFAAGGQINASTAFNLGLTMRNEVTVKGIQGGTVSEIVLNNAITWGTLKLQEESQLYRGTDLSWVPNSYEAYKGALWINSGAKQWQNLDIYFEVIVYNKGVQVFKQEIINTNYGFNKYYIKPIFPKMAFDEIKIIGYPKELRVISDEVADKVQFITLDQVDLLESEINKYKNIRVIGYGGAGNPDAYSDKKMDEFKRFELLYYEFLLNNKSIIDHYSRTLANSDSKTSVVFHDGGGSNVSAGSSPNSYIYDVPLPTEQSYPYAYELLNQDGTIGKIYIIRLK